MKVLLLIFLVNGFSCESYTPIVLWHGIADTCCNTTLIGKLQTQLLEYLPGAHVISLQIGNSSEEDYRNSYLMHPDKQVAIACDIIKSDRLLANGYNAIGFSQGSQLMRGLAQRCPEPRMKNLITLAGQHQGIYGIPIICNVSSEPPCNPLRRVINKFAYLSFMQKSFVPATYWHNPLNKNAYARGSTYLADINNEKSINQSYINNLQLLENFVMVKHEADQVVVPIETSWFGFYKRGQSKVIETLRQSKLYVSDRLGLKQMDIDGKLHFLSATWNHAEIEWTWFRKNVVDKFLR